MRLTARLATAAAVAAVLALTGCSTDADTSKTLKVVAIQPPMTDVVEAAATAIGDGYEIELIEVSDYVTANTLLNSGEVYANFSQHVPYMETFNAANDGTLTGVQPVYNFQIAFYSKTLDDIAELPTGATIAVPDDASNLGRALKLLADKGIVTLDPAVDPYEADLDDIVENPHEVEFLQVAITLLNAAYEEADLVYQWPSHIAALGLNPDDDGLITELDDRFALYLVVRDQDADSAATEALKAAFRSDAVREVIEANETIEPAF